MIQQRPLLTSTPVGPFLLRTRVAEMLGLDLPIFCGPISYVSDIDLAVAACEAGILGCFSAPNYTSPGQLLQDIREVRKRTNRAFAIYIALEPTSMLRDFHLDVCRTEQVPVIITGPGDPSRVLETAQKAGAYVFVVVTRFEEALMAQSLGADGVVAVTVGAGGRTGRISPLTLIPMLRKSLDIPIVCAGGIGDGYGMAAALAMGASAIQMSTRFVASSECQVIEEYKHTIVSAKPASVMVTDRLTDRPLSVVRTPFTQRLESQPGWIQRLLLSNRLTRPITQAIMTTRSFALFNRAAFRTTGKKLWGAGHSVGLINQVKTVNEIIDQLIANFADATRSLPQLERSESVVLH